MQVYLHITSGACICMARPAPIESSERREELEIAALVRLVSKKARPAPIESSERREELEIAALVRLASEMARN